MYDIVNNEKLINNEIFMDYFGYFIPSFLAKILYETYQAKNTEITS